MIKRIPLERHNHNIITDDSRWEEESRQAKAEMAEDRQHWHANCALLPWITRMHLTQ